jgi:hypothetical protein
MSPDYHISLVVASLVTNIAYLFIVGEGKVEMIETWHNAANAQKLQKCDKGRCGGVPFFYNDKTDKFICGSAEYEDLKKWANG